MTLIKRLSILFLAAVVLAGIPAFAEIRHLELGAANYDADASLSESARARRFSVLVTVVDELIAKYGNTGVIYLNDLAVSGLELAAGHLRSFLRAKGLHGIRVETLPGDYNSIPLPEVNTMNMTNPMIGQLPSETTCLKDCVPDREMAKSLARLAARSRTGLQINTYFHYEIGELKHHLPPGAVYDLPGIGLPYFDWNGDQIVSEGPTRRYAIAKSALERLFQAECDQELRGFSVN